MKRLLFNGVATLSMLLCLGCAAMWVYKPPVLPGLSTTTNSQGGKSVERLLWVPHVVGVRWCPEQKVPAGPGAYTSWGRQWSVSVAWWALAMVTAVAPLVKGVAMLMARRRRRTGLCPGCGYDLTGNASRVCPEYGAMI